VCVCRGLITQSEQYISLLNTYLSLPVVVVVVVFFYNISDGRMDGTKGGRRDC
jgi:hypothetical protein